MKNEFMQGCEDASKNGQCSYSGTFYLYQDVGLREDYLIETAESLLKESLADLGLQCSEVTYGRIYNNGFDVSGTWTADAETKGKNINPYSGGTCVTCPICHEHRPAVALVPCGHVVCRDCHRSGKQLRQCPMCRKVIISATEGLFMD